MIIYNLYNLTCDSNLFTGKPSTFCGGCKKYLQGVDSLAVHVRVHTTHPSQLAAPPTPPPPKEVHRCSFCARAFQKKSAMKMHVDKVHMTGLKKEVC